MSHVVPDLVQKILKGQDPLHLLGDGKQVRHYTYGGDLAKGIVIAMEHPDALNEDFNLLPLSRPPCWNSPSSSGPRSRPEVPFRYVTDPPFEHDVQRRVPSVDKAKKVLGFEATTNLSDHARRGDPWVTNAIRDGRI